MPKRSRLPAWSHEPLAVALRTAMTPVHLAGYGASSRAARAIAHLIAQYDAKHFERAHSNLAFAFPTWDEARINETARGTFEHLCQLGVEFMYVPRLVTRDGCSTTLRFCNIAPAVRALCAERPVILITGHVGNWELIGYAISMLGFGMHAVYRPLDLKPLDRWMRATRESRGLTLVSKFGAAREIPAVLGPGAPVGLVADQSGGDRGVFVPFFGRLTSTYKMVALLAMQKQATIVCGVARRLPMHDVGADRAARTPAEGSWADSLAAGDVLAEIEMPATSHDRGGGMRFAVEVTDSFGPEDWEGQPDKVYYISARYRRAMETMIRRAPEQYFWMHRLWRSRPAHERLQKPFPIALRDKLLDLPWMSHGEVERLMAQSEADTRALAGNTG